MPSLMEEKTAPARMPSKDPRAKRMVADSAAILKRFYFLQREVALMQAGWLPGAEHWQSKLLLPEFLWQDALIARELRERVLELRYPERRIVPGDDEPLLQLWRQFRDAPNDMAFAAGLAEALKPALKKAFQDYLQVADHLDDSPTLRILKQAVEDIEEQICRWREALDDARKVYPERRPSMESWRHEVETVIGKLNEGGVMASMAGDIPSFNSTRAGGKPFQISRTGKRDKRFLPVLFPWPDSLDPKRGPGEGLELQIRQAVHHLNEVWAAEMAGAVIFDLAEQAPPEFLEEGARWCYDEARHCRMGYARLKNWGFQEHEMPLGSFSYDAGAEADAVTRLGIIYYFESTYIHTKPERAKIFGAEGDRVSSHDMDFDWADELIHAYYGARWLKHFLEKQGDPRGPNDIRKEAEGCVSQIRQRATAVDQENTENAWRKTMQCARELASRRKGEE